MLVKLDFLTFRGARTLSPRFTCGTWRMRHLAVAANRPRLILIAYALFFNRSDDTKPRGKPKTKFFRGRKASFSPPFPCISFRTESRIPIDIHQWFVLHRPSLTPSKITFKKSRLFWRAFAELLQLSDFFMIFPLQIRENVRDSVFTFLYILTLFLQNEQWKIITSHTTRIGDQRSNGGQVWGWNDERRKSYIGEFRSDSRCIVGRAEHAAKGMIKSSYCECREN